MVARLILLGFWLGAVHAQEPQPVTHETLKELFSRTRTINIVFQRSKIVGVYTREGVARLDWGTGGAQGTWRINGDKFCTKYPGIRRGYENCFSLKQTGANSYITIEEDGTVGSTWQVEP